MSLEYSKTHKKTGIKEGNFNWQTSVGGVKHDIPVQAFWHPDAITADPGAMHLHYYGGLGAERRGMIASVDRLSRFGAPAVGVLLDFTHFDPTPVNFERVIIEVPVAAAENFSENIGLENEGDINLMGQSQGGAVMKAAARAPELFNAVGVISPVGLTSEHFGEVTEKKRIEFLMRYAKNALFAADQNLILHPDNLSAVIEGLGRLISDVVNRRIVPKIDFALDQDARPDVKLLVESGHPFRLFAAEHDAIFKLNEYYKSLSEFDLEDLIEEIPGSHTFPTSRTQDRQFKPAVDWLKSVA